MGHVFCGVLCVGHVVYGTRNVWDALCVVCGTREISV